MVKKSRRQKGGTRVTITKINYSNRQLKNDDLKLLLRKYMLSRNTLSLNIENNNLTELPELPLALVSLSCGNNQLTVLPKLPFFLLALRCNNNQLTVLPKLPLEVFHLSCDSNQLTVLPELPPNLTDLSCESNQLTVLPELPESLTSIYFDNNPFIAPFDRFYAEYQASRLDDLASSVKELIDKVNGYYASQRSKGRNLASMMQTLGRTELQGRYAVAPNNTPRNLEYDESRIVNKRGKSRKVLNGRVRTLNKIPYGPLSHIGSFLTGERGSVNQQRKTLKNTVNRSHRNPNEMAVN